MNISLLVVLLLIQIVISKMSFAECNEYKIIEHDDRVEVVCVGAPLSSTEQKEIDEKYSQQKEEGLRDVVKSCYDSLPKGARSSFYRRNRDELSEQQQIARCRQLESELLAYQKLRPKRPEHDNRMDLDDYTAIMQGNVALQNAELQRQQAEIQRQQLELQRIQHQQKLNQIWKY